MTFFSSLRATQLSLAIFLALFCANASLGQQLTSATGPDVYAPSFTRDAMPLNTKKAWALHVTPTKFGCGEMPLVVSKRVSNTLVAELGGGPAFRDRVAERLFGTGKFEQLPFVSSNVDVGLGWGVQAGVRYLTAREMLGGFYLNPEVVYTNRSVTYPTANPAAPTYEGRETALNLRVLLGYDRALSSYSDHLFYGGYLGFGMRRYNVDYFALDKNESGTRRAVETIPTVHLGYRIGWVF